MDINISLSPATSITANYLVVAIYEATSPTVVADFQAFAAPHVASRNISFTNVNNVPHYVKVYENTTATVGGTIRHQFLYNPWFKNAIIRDDLFLIANTTAGFASNGNGGSYTDTSLAGWTWSLERRGFGTMQRTVDYSWDSGTNTWALLATLDNPTPNIQDGEIFVIHFQPQITTTNTPQSTSISLFSGVEIINANTALDATIMGKAVQLAGETPFFTVTLPDLNLIQANRPLIFMSNEGSHVNASIAAYAGQSIKWLNGTLTEVVAGQSEEIWLYKWVDPNDSSVMCWKVLHADGNFKTVGEIIDIYKDAGVLNALYCAGQSISKSSYKRLWNFVQTLDSSMIVSDANWSNVALNNKGKFADVDANNFRLPQLYSTGFLRAVNSSTRKAGSFEDYQFPDHKHSQTIGTLPTTIFGRLLISLITIGTQIGNYSKTGTNNGTDLTSGPCKTDGSAFLTTVGSGNYPANTGGYKLIRF